MLSRRKVLIACGAVALVAPFEGFPQGPVPKVPRIGFLEASMPQNGTPRFLEDFRQGLREQGDVEGKNVRLEIRWGEGKLERLPTLADELVRLNVALILPVNSPSVIAAR